MGSKLQTNTIITGYINSYCLICECYFDTDKDIVDHIEDGSHVDKLLACPYLDKFGDNHIRKVKKGYYCEFCSVLLATAASVSLHVQERSHYERKGRQLLRRPSGVHAVTAFDDLLIDEKAWHGLFEDTCAICNEEFANESIHKTETGHLLKLVQTKVEFAADNNIYRKTDDSSFQCLTCNTVFILSTLDDHFTSSEHKKLYTKCQDEYKKYSEQCKLKSAEKFNDKVGEKDKKDDVKVRKDEKDKKDGEKEMKGDVKAQKDEKDKKNGETEQKGAVKAQKDEKNKKDGNKENKGDVKTQKDDRNTQINEDKTLIDDAKNEKKEDKSYVDKNHNNIKEEAIKEISASKSDCTEMVVARINASPSTSPEPEEDEAAVYANANNLTYNAGNTNAYCRICETKLPAPLHSMKEHVNGKEHKSRLAKANQKASANPNRRLTKKPMSKFIDFCVNVENVFHEDVVVNEKYCIPLASFVMMTQVGGRYRCQACEVTVCDENIGVHTDSSRHERAMQDTPVLTCLPDTEFVREVRPNIFHCGYCNLILPRWEDVNNHLQSREHRENKDACVWRLKRHLPAILERRRRHEMDFIQMMIMRNLMRR